MYRQIQKIISILLPITAFCLFTFVSVDNSFAQSKSVLGDDAFRYLEGEHIEFGTGAETTGEGMAEIAVRRGISLVKYLMGGIALIYGLIYAMGLIFARGNEENISKNRLNFLYTFMGFVIIMVADGVASIFSAETATSGELINYQAGQDQLRKIADYLKYLFGSVILLIMAISSVQMIIAQGNEEEITKQKKHLIYSGIGMLVILLASNIISAIYVVRESGVTEAAGTGVTTNQLLGVIRLILAFLGPLAVAFTIYAGFMFLTAFDNEERAGKGKKMIIAGVTGIIMIYASFALVSTFYKGAVETTSVCGNGVIEPGEECDDSDSDNDDGCSSQCTVEQNYTCVPDPNNEKISVCKKL